MELNKIYNGDAYELIKEIPNKSIDLILTDPPYLFKNLHKGSGIFKDRPRGYITEIRENELGESIDLSILDEFVRVLKKINIYIWCNKGQMLDYMNYFIKEKKCNFELIVWAKTNTPPFANGHYLNDKEYCLYFWEKGVKIKGNYDTLKTFYVSTTNIEDKKLYKHPTIKPLNIIKNFIINSVEEGGGHCA